MPEITFRSPNFFDREIDLSTPVVGGPSGIPASAIGTANKGPAFVPVTVADKNSLIDVFGLTDPTRLGLYAATQWLKYQKSFTYLRVLGAGANVTSAQVDTTVSTGRTAKAGFKITPVVATHDNYGRHTGATQFIAAKHALSTNEAVGMPMFSENDSRSSAGVMNLIRGIVFMPYTARLMILDGDETTAGKFVGAGPDDVGTVVSGKVKLVISSTLGATFFTQDGYPGIKVMTASLNPTNSDYFAKIMNTNSNRFYEEQHYLYADFAVDDELASAATVGILSGSVNSSDSSPETTTKFKELFGGYDSRFTAPSTPMFISQPYGGTEYELFSFEAIDDGEYANQLYKISISGVRMSDNDSYRYGSFNVLVRDWNDSDLNQRVVEQFMNCNLDPNSDRYVAKIVGDRKIYYDFDATSDAEKRLVVSGKYPNNSKFVRIVMNDSVDRGVVPQTVLPFGFKGLGVLKTNDDLTDAPGVLPRLSLKASTVGLTSRLSGSIVPPVPFRFKVTRGDALAFGEPGFIGEASNGEVVNPNFYWGVKFERNSDVLNPNSVGEKNELIGSLTKFVGIKKLDALMTGSGADTLNNNKFTLARVAFPNGAISDLTSSVEDHMRDSCYLRNAKFDMTTYALTDPSSSFKRITFGTLAASTSSVAFNRFQQYAKFTTFLAGGFDGLNMLDRSNRLMDDRSTSFDAGGGAISSYVPNGFSTNQNGVEQRNSNVVSYRAAIDIMTDGMSVSSKLLAIPGITESYIVDYAMKKTKEYGMAMYVADIPDYDESGNRLYSDQATRPDVDKTCSTFAGRAINNNYVATYWPQAYIQDDDANRRVKVPASIVAFGALSFNDKVSYPWFAPAGFNRAALDDVKNVVVRLDAEDRNVLQDNRINPIATFPNAGYVIYGQKTLQMKKSALDRINVRRMLLEVKRQIVDIANRMCFENNTPDVRDKFKTDCSVKLAIVQANSGIERFSVVCDDSNNSKQDENLNRLNGRITLVPTRTAEFIALDFIITRTGVAFSS